jgi:hypothetical protein
MEEDDVLIPFSGEYLGITSKQQTAPWIREEDKVALLLAVSIYGTPIPVIDNYELVDNTFKTRFAAWIDKNTRLLIVACRGTSIGYAGGGKDLKDDMVSLY